MMRRYSVDRLLSMKHCVVPEIEMRVKESLNGFELLRGEMEVDLSAVSKDLIAGSGMDEQRMAKMLSERMAGLLTKAKGKTTRVSEKGLGEMKVEELFGDMKNVKKRKESKGHDFSTLGVPTFENYRTAHVVAPKKTLGKKIGSSSYIGDSAPFNDRTNQMRNGVGKNVQKSIPKSMILPKPTEGYAIKPDTNQFTWREKTPPGRKMGINPMNLPHPLHMPTEQKSYGVPKSSMTNYVRKDAENPRTKSKSKSPVKAEISEHKLSQRQKQIDYGYNTPGYENYISEIPKYKRKKEHPRTPNKYQHCSKRSWDGQIRKWRRELHRFDPPELQEQLFEGSTAEVLV